MFDKNFNPDAYVDKLLQNGKRQKAAYKSDNPISIESEKITSLSEVTLGSSLQRMNFEIDLRRFPADYENDNPLPGHPRRFKSRNSSCVEDIRTRQIPSFTIQNYHLNLSSSWRWNTTLRVEELQQYERDRYGGEPTDSTNLFHWLSFSEELKDHILSLLQKLVNQNGNEDHMRAVCCYDIPKSTRIRSRTHDVKKEGVFKKPISDLISINLFHLHVFNPSENIPDYHDYKNKIHLVSYMQHPLASYVLKEIVSTGHKNFSTVEYPNLKL